MTYLGPALIFGLLFAPAVRLLSMAGRTRRTPEIWAGLYFFGISIGLPLRVLGHSLMVAEPALAADLNTFGHLFFAAASCAMAVFTWRVFRADEAWARALALATIATIVATTASVLLTGSANAEQSISVALTNFARVVPILWAFFESARYWRAMTRRARLGLADPVVTNRFLLWSVWTAALAVLPGMTLVLRLLGFVAVSFGYGAQIAHAETHFVVLLVRMIFLLTAPVGALALSLSFFPPEQYLAFIRRRALNSHEPDTQTT